MQITTALDGSLERNLRLSPGDDVTIELTVYQVDGDADPLTYTDPEMSVGGGDSYPVGEEFAIPLDLGRTPYRLTVLISGNRTTVAYGYIETTQPGPCSVTVCGCVPSSGSSSGGGGGTGTVTSVNSVAPDGDGNVELVAADIDAQPADDQLTALASLTGAADRLPYFTGLAAMALATFTGFGRTMLAWVDAAAARAGLGLGTSATLNVDTDGTLSANSDTRVPSQKAVKTYADQLIAAQDAMVFKGVIDCSANPNYPAADLGWTYRVSVAGKIGGASGINVEAGDILLCLTDGTVSGNQATVGANWTVIQTNIDGAVIGPASAVDGDVALFDTATGKLIKDGGTFATLLAAAIHAATNKATPVDADEVGIADSAASYGLKRLTLVNLAAYIFSGWGPRIAAATAKTTPANADGFLITDSAASGAAKFLSFTNLKALFIAAVTPGTSGNVLTSNGSSWVSAAPAGGGGGWVLLTGSTVTASGATTMDVEWSTTAYDQIAIWLSGITCAADAVNIQLRFKVGGSYDTGANYLYSIMSIDSGNSGFFGLSTAGTPANQGVIGSSMGSAAGKGMDVLIMVHTPSSTSLQKRVDVNGSFIKSNGNVAKIDGFVQNSSTAAMTGVRVFMSSNNLSGVGRAYGGTELMTRYHATSAGNIAFTPAEEAARDAEEAAAAAAFAPISARQFQRALDSLGYMAAVQVKLDAATTAQQIEWNEAPVFTRNWSLMLAVIGTALNSTQLDTVFTTGKGL